MEVTYFRTAKVIKEKSGKYVSIEVEVSRECVVKVARITGDFFAYPPEAVDNIEKYLAGKKVTHSLIEDLRTLVNDAVLAGVGRERFQSLLTDVLEEVMKACRKSAAE
ncbi:MAG: hypothetical protein J7J20_04200 [Desulfurococcales archaeon]|nr:hypothetical protein [Desulfurococcales archaeon]